MRRIIVAALLAVWSLPAVAAPGDTPKDPKILPAAWHDVGAMTFKLAKGESFRLVSVGKMQGETSMSMNGQDMSFGMSGTTVSGTKSVVASDTDGKYKLDMLTDELSMKTEMEVMGQAMLISILNDQIKVTQGDNVLVDTVTGKGGELVKMFKGQGVGYNVKGSVTITPDGKIVGQMEGDPAFLKAQGATPSAGPFLVVFSKDPLKLGATWSVETNLSAMQQLQLKTPTKIVSTMKVEGLATVDGVECIDISLNIPVKVADAKAQMEQQGVEVAFDLKSMSGATTGHAYYDPKAGRFVYALTNSDIQMEGQVGLPGGMGQMPMKMHMKVKAGVFRVPVAAAAAPK
ncbi:MAG: hypothetical protein NT029_17510 [Armatimonadetes bacterium]|nr:hypothetical protein [Armatimonadota bacterium]